MLKSLLPIFIYGTTTVFFFSIFSFFRGGIRLLPFQKQFMVYSDVRAKVTQDRVNLFHLIRKPRMSYGGDFFLFGCIDD